MKMRIPKDLILKKIHNSFLTLSIATAILSTILAANPWLIICQLRCVYLGWDDTFETYIFMLILSSGFLMISLIVYMVRRIIIKKSVPQRNKRNLSPSKIEGSISGLRYVNSPEKKRIDVY